MIDLTELTLAMVDTFRRIPEVLDIVVDPKRITPYLYLGPTQNMWPVAVTQTPGPSILVGWQETVANDSPNGWWKHRFEYILRGVTSGSPLDLLTALLNGIPVPGDGQRWRLCEFLPGTDPAKIVQVVRQPDQESLDYIVVIVEILETGDA